MLRTTCCPRDVLVGQLHGVQTLHRDGRLGCLGLAGWNITGVSHERWRLRPVDVFQVDCGDGIPVRPDGGVSALQRLYRENAKRKSTLL